MKNKLITKFRKKSKKDSSQLRRQKVIRKQEILEPTNLDLKKGKLQRKVKAILRHLILDQKTNKIKTERRDQKQKQDGKKVKALRRVCLEPRKCL